MATLSEIEELAAWYARARSHLSCLVEDMQQKIDALRREAMPEIKSTLALVAQNHLSLKAALEESRGLFTKPKTRIFSGIKVGYVKQRGEVIVDDEEATIRRIREQLPKDQAELLIKVKESVVKGAIYDLVAGDLKRLGIKIGNDTDVPVIKPVDSEVDKLVAALLSEAEKVGEAA